MESEQPLFPAQLAPASSQLLEASPSFFFFFYRQVDLCDAWISSPLLWGLLEALVRSIDLQDLKLPKERLACWRRVVGRWEACTCVSSSALNIITATSIFYAHLPGHSGSLALHQTLGLGHSASRAGQQA